MILDKLVELLNEMVQSDDTRRMTSKILMSPHVTFDDVSDLPDDLIVSAQEPISVTALGIINTALVRAGEPRRLVAVVDDAGMVTDDG